MKGSFREAIFTHYNDIVYHTFSKYPRLFFKYLSVLRDFRQMLFAICKKYPKSTRSVPSRQGYRRKAESFFCPTFCTLQKVGERSAAKRRSVATGNTKRRHGRRKRGREAAKKAHEVCRPCRDKLSAKRKVSKGFNCVCAKLLPL